MMMNDDSETNKPILNHMNIGISFFFSSNNICRNKNCVWFNLVLFYRISEALKRNLFIALPLLGIQIILRNSYNIHCFFKIAFTMPVLNWLFMCRRSNEMFGLTTKLKLRVDCFIPVTQVFKARKVSFATQRKRIEVHEGVPEGKIKPNDYRLFKGKELKRRK